MNNRIDSSIATKSKNGESTGGNWDKKSEVKYCSGGLL